jgi:hypothetical protein
MASTATPTPLVSDLDIAEQALISAVDKKKKKAPVKKRKSISKAKKPSKKKLQQLASTNSQKLPWR